MKKKIFLALLVVLLVIQFFPIKHENPDSPAEKDFIVSLGSEYPEAQKMIKDACYDCHSNNTVYPSYTRVQPLGWFIRSHIRGGRMKVNFSNWSDYSPKEKIHHLQECKEVLEENRMPMKSYTWMHPPSKLSKEQKQQLISFFEAAGSK